MHAAPAGSLQAPTSVAWRLARRLALVGVAALCVSAIALVTFDYRREVAALEDRVRAIDSSLAGSLGLSLWRLDEEQARVQLSGVVSQPDVRYARILERVGESGVAREWLRSGEEDGEANGLRLFRVALSMRGDGGEAVARLGELEIGFDDGALLRRVFDRAADSLLAQAAVLAALLIAVMAIIRRLVTRDLRRLAAVARSSSGEADEFTFAFERRRASAGDEIDEVIGALEGLRERLAASHQALEQSQNQLLLDNDRRRAAEARALDLAYRDSLTGLPNRLAFTEALEGALADPAASGFVLFFDLDDFKLINDARGHRFGDELLRATAQRLREALGESVLIARLGGDEFVALGAAAEPVGGATAAAERVFTALARPLPVDGEEVALRISIGVSCYPLHGDDADTLLRHADIALYAAKTAGSNLWRVFGLEMREAVERRHRIERALVRALDEGALEAYVQPIVDTAGRTVGAEVLARWQDPEIGTIRPDEFVPVAEAIGLMPRLTSAILDQALAAVGRWIAEGHWTEVNHLAINVGAREFLGPGFVTRIADALARHGVAPTVLVIEITEALLVHDFGTCRQRLLELDRRGIRVVIDDFGVGFSSLSYLGQLPFHGLKIDRRFVAELGAAESSRPVVAAIIGLARHFGLEVVAEGVEDASQLQQLESLGCGRFQGFLFSPPVPITRFGEAPAGQHNRRPGRTTTHSTATSD